MYIIVAVLVVVIIIAGAAAYVLSNNGGSTNATATPTPAPTVTVADASSISFNSSITAGGTTTMYMWRGIDIHTTANSTIRVDLEGGYSYILAVANETSYDSTDGGLTWTTGTFATDWAAWGATWQDYLDNLSHWNGSDATYAINDATIGNAAVSNIVVNPTIPASVFNQ